MTTAMFIHGEMWTNYSGGKISGHSGAWLFGKNTQRLGLLMPAHPKIGDKFNPKTPRLSHGKRTKSFRFQKPDRSGGNISKLF